jgi:hypothetical protein
MSSIALEAEHRSQINALLRIANYKDAEIVRLDRLVSQQKSQLSRMSDLHARELEHHSKENRSMRLELTRLQNIIDLIGIAVKDAVSVREPQQAANTDNDSDIWYIGELN